MTLFLITDRLDGLAKRKNDGKPQTMEDFLQVPDCYDREDSTGKKRVSTLKTIHIFSKPGNPIVKFQYYLNFIKITYLRI